jgi:hypothetical protein
LLVLAHEWMERRSERRRPPPSGEEPELVGA